MLKLSPATIEQIMRFIIPEIKGAASESLRAYEQGARPGGGNNFDNYMLGCSCWCNAYNRLDRALNRHPFFTKKTYKKVLTITCPNWDDQLTFYVSRVDERGRIPCAGRSIKLQLQEQAFLSDEVQDIIAHATSSVYMLGYDISTQRGLGKITFDVLSATDRGRFQSDTVYIFDDDMSAIQGPHIPPEEIKHPTVTREVLANHSKKATE